jgi:hypothetical protein
MVLCDFAVLMKLAYKLGQAEKLAKFNGDFESVEKAKKEHDDYVDAISKSDGMINART